jgi:hypothetical protein
VVNGGIGVEPEGERPIRPDPTCATFRSRTDRLCTYEPELRLLSGRTG